MAMLFDVVQRTVSGRALVQVATVHGRRVEREEALVQSRRKGLRLQCPGDNVQPVDRCFYHWTDLRDRCGRDSPCGSQRSSDCSSGRRDVAAQKQVVLVLQGRRAEPDRSHPDSLCFVCHRDVSGSIGAHHLHSQRFCRRRYLDSPGVCYPCSAAGRATVLECTMCTNTRVKMTTRAPPVRSPTAARMVSATRAPWTRWRTSQGTTSRPSEARGPDPKFVEQS